MQENFEPVERVEINPQNLSDNQCRKILPKRNKKKLYSDFVCESSKVKCKKPKLSDTNEKDTSSVDMTNLDGDW